MSPSSPAAVLDPLSDPQEAHSGTATPLATGVSLAARPRRDRTAPDLTTIPGAEAVSIVRAAGFIAAIESVASKLAEGTVIDQQPPAGERLEREGVVTLRLATPPLDEVALASASEARSAFEQTGASLFCR